MYAISYIIMDPEKYLAHCQALFLGPVYTRWSHPSWSVAIQTRARDKRRPGLSLFDLLKSRIQPSNGQAGHRIPGPTGPCCTHHTLHGCLYYRHLTAILLRRNQSSQMQTRPSVAPIQPTSLLLWATLYRRGLLPYKLRCVTTSSVPRTQLDSSSSRIKRM